MPKHAVQTSEIVLEDDQIEETFPDVATSGVVLPVPPPIEYQEFGSAKELRSHIFQTKDIQEEVMDIPEWKTRVLIKGLTGKQRANVMQACIGADGVTADIGKMYALMVINTLRHPLSRDLIFSQADRDPLMNEKSGGVIERIAMAAMRVSGLETQAQEKLAKN